jgi:hypothetical protein
MATSACPIQVARQGVRVFSSLESAIVATDSFFSRNVAFGTHRGLKQRALNSPALKGNQGTLRERQLGALRADFADRRVRRPPEQGDDHQSI